MSEATGSGIVAERSKLHRLRNRVVWLALGAARLRPRCLRTWSEFWSDLSLKSQRFLAMRMFKITACVPSQTRIRTQRELQNTFFTKLVSYDNWFKEQQRIQKMGGKIVKVELATGRPGTNTGLL